MPTQMRTIPSFYSASTALANGYTLYEIEAHARKAIVRAALKSSGGHKGNAAKRLGIHRNVVTQVLRSFQ